VDAPINIKDVAAHAGVSVGIVSNVPNRPVIVAQATPERVRTAIKALGFVRNESAGQLRAGRSRMIGLVVLDMGQPILHRRRTRRRGRGESGSLSVILCNSNDEAAKQ